jgi:hypothetical protein
MLPLHGDFPAVKTTSDFMRLGGDARPEDRLCRSIAAISVRTAC